MTDNNSLFDSDAPSATGLEHNINEFSVGEISGAVKRTLEGAFGRVRVRGEISRPNYHGSGHLYFTLKDEDAAMDGVCWRGAVGKLGITLEEGMEVICTGRISSYPRSSKYQIVVEAVELAGEGALLKLLEDRRKKLTAEGLFDPDRKQDLPFLPEIIGVITSPTGAVIRDILHRLSDRFPRHVLLWPVIVQGDGAAEQVADAITGFNGCEPEGVVPRPDLLIVARGGGSLEDLWAFNEVVVVRAAAESDIPLISAVGHETDTTLIDFASDVRAPTPTAAAEMAVPVRADLEAQLLDSQRRLVAGLERCWEDQRLQLEGLARGLPQPDHLLEEAAQRLDSETDRLKLSIANRLEQHQERVAGVGARLRHPREVMTAAGERLSQTTERFDLAIMSNLQNSETRFAGLEASDRLPNAMTRIFKSGQDRLAGQGQLLESLSYKGVLERGFALVRDDDGRPVMQAADGVPGGAIEIEFADGSRGAIFDDGDPSKQKSAKAPVKAKKTPAKKAAQRKSSSPDDSQGSLL
ncbi:MAG: exodeoxyribonuclease VII large subunit [Alphaproteobacteria bacterium]|nr:exodeoxyribonuclease VII large subunit [Alphaproteobacteria bacterium]